MEKSFDDREIIIGKYAMINLKIVDDKFCNCINNLIIHKYGIRNEKVIKAYVR